MNVKDLQISASLVVAIMGATVGSAWWASQNLALAADVEKAHLELRLEVEQAATQDRIERYRRELRYHTEPQIREDIKADIKNARSRNLSIQNSLDNLEK